MGTSVQKYTTKRLKKIENRGTKKRRRYERKAGKQKKRETKTPSCGQNKTFKKPWTGNPFSKEQEVRFLIIFNGQRDVITRFPFEVGLGLDGEPEKYHPLPHRN